jgi:hypothetical protein
MVSGFGIGKKEAPRAELEVEDAALGEHLL